MKTMHLCSFALCALLFVHSSTSFAQQKIAHVDISAVMKQLPEAQEAQRKLDQFVSDWQKELDKMEKEWQQKYSDYDKRKLILTDQGRINYEKELQQLDQQIGDFRDKKFGQNGELFQKQNEVMKPVQNKMFKVIEDLAKEEGIDYVFDRSGEILLLYANDKNDLTEKVLSRMRTFGK